MLAFSLQGDFEFISSSLDSGDEMDLCNGLTIAAS